MDATARDETSRAGLIRVVVSQHPSCLDAAANRARASAAVANAAEMRPDVVVLPEAAMHDFGSPDLDLAAVAEPLDGPFVETLSAAAAAADAVVVAGMFELRTENGRLATPYNTVVAMAPNGRLLARYRKLHLYDAFSHRESDRLSAGDENPPVFEVGGVRLGIITCYDLRFPEVARTVVDAGAAVQLIPAAWVPGRQKVQQWQALLAARAIENMTYVVGAAQPGPVYSGHSAIIDPMGVVVASTGEAPALVTASVDSLRVSAARRVNPSLANRRFTVTGPHASRRLG